MPRSVMTCCVAGMRRFVELLEVFRTLPDVHDMYAVGPRVTTRDARFATHGAGARGQSVRE